MKTILMTLVAVLAFAGSANAQTSVKELTWTDFVQGIEFREIGEGTWEFTHATRPLHHYTVVKAPAGTMSVRTFFRLAGDDEMAMYLVVLDPATTVEVRTTAGVEERSVSFRAMFSCPLATDGACRALLGKLLRDGAEMQSLGPTNSEYHSSGKVPEGLTLSFLINSSGKFKY